MATEFEPRVKGRRTDKSIVPPLARGLLDMSQALLPVMTAVIGGLWVAFTYLDNQKNAQTQSAAQAQKDEIGRSLQARKPFLDQQIRLYFETAEVAGRLVTIPYRDDEWTKSRVRFFQLFWTELSLVEDDNVKAAMQNFAANLSAWEKQWPTQGETDPKAVQRYEDAAEDFRQSAYRLVRQLKESLQRSWIVEPGIVPKK